MFAIELREGKDRPKEKGRLDHDEKGSTAGLLLRLTKSLWGHGKCVILDSGFCVLKALVELRKVGVFASSVIKKRKYWPKFVDGDKIDEKCKDLPVGETATVNGKLDNVDYKYV